MQNSTDRRKIMSEPIVSSLAKALRVLECFTVSEPELGVTEISKKLGIGKSNAHNIISTYCQICLLYTSRCV